MKMIRHFMGCIREYKKPTVLTLLCMVGEVAIEVLIPFFTANLVNEIKNGAALGGVVRVGLVAHVNGCLGVQLRTVANQIFPDDGHHHASRTHILLHAWSLTSRCPLVLGSLFQVTP